MPQAKNVETPCHLGRSEFQKMAKTLEAATENKYVSAGSNRVRGDEAKALGDYKEAIEHFTKWKDALLKISSGKTTVEVAESLAVLGDTYQKQGMYPESMECLEKALEVQLKELGEEHATVADTYAKLGWTCSQDGKYDKAMEYQQKGLSIRLKVHGGEDHVDVGHSHHMLGGYTMRKANTRKR